MMCLMEFVRKMLHDKLEERAKELALTKVQIEELKETEKTRTDTVQANFDKYKEEKSREIEELNTLSQDDSAKKTGQIDAATA